ncbi:MAG: hypothetical protein ACRDPK_14705 [Carbonactinosporaceae bacterium]
MSFRDTPGPLADPGYTESLNTGTPLAAIRRLGFFAVAAPVLVFLLLPLVVHDGQTPTWTMVLSVLAGAAPPFWLHLVGFGATPLEPGIDDVAAAERSLAALRGATGERLAITALPLAVGLVLTFIGSSLLPYALGFLVGWPQMLRATPTTRTIEGLRAHLESRGVTSHLWEALLTSASKAMTRR